MSKRLTDVYADRIDSSGRTVERAKIGINVGVRSVFLHIDGERLTKSYVLPRSEWDRLIEAVNSPTQGRRSHPDL